MQIHGASAVSHPILDIGCGDGHFAAIAYTEPIDIGLDPMTRDLDEAAGLRPGIFLDLVRGSATTLPFPDAVFNTVVSNCVIEHIPDVQATLSEISRVLKPGGTFATTLPSQHYPEYLLGSTIARKVGIQRAATAYGDFFNKISYHYHVDAPEVWSNRFDAVGLDVVKHTYYFSPAAHRHSIWPTILARPISPPNGCSIDGWFIRFRQESSNDGIADTTMKRSRARVHTSFSSARNNDQFPPLSAPIAMAS